MRISVKHNIKKNIITLLSVLILSSSLFILSEQRSFAQLGSNSLSIGYAPTALYLKASAGETKKGELTFWNLAPAKIKYFVYAKGFKQIQDIAGTSRILTDFEEDNDPYSASKWVKLPFSSVDLHPNQYTKIKYTINIPKDSAAGEYHTLIYLISEEAQNRMYNSSAAMADLGAGPAILIQVGQKDEKAEIEFFRTDKKFYEYTPVDFLTRYLNKGNTHITPTGDIILTNFLGQEIDRIKFNGNKQGLLRGTSATYTDTWNKENPFVKNGKLAIGPIKAKLITTYRSDTPGFAPLVALTSFWVIPWKIILLILTIIIITIRLFTKRKKESKIDENELIDQSKLYEKYWAKLK